MELTKEEILAVLKDTIKQEADTYIQGQLKEHAEDAAAKIAKQNAEIAKATEEEEAKAKQFKHFREFLSAVRNYRINREIDNRLSWLPSTGTKTAGHMAIGDDSQGGFLVPEVFRAELNVIALEQEVIRPNGPTVLPMTTDTLKIPYVLDTTHATNVYGGVLAYWTAEAGAKTPTKPAFAQMELTPHKLAGLTYTSNELLADSAIALEPLIKSLFGKAWGYFEDDAFINGSGVGQPLGILNCPSLVANFRNTVLHIYYQDIVEMYNRMLPASRKNAVWILNPEALTELMQLVDDGGAPAAGARVIWINHQMGAANPIPGTIFGRPFFVSEKMAGLGSQGDIGFFDLSYFLIGDRQPITIDASTHVAFTTDETAWRFVLRVAAQCWPSSALTPRHGTATLSPFVVLAAATS